MMGETSSSNGDEVEQIKSALKAKPIKSVIPVEDFLSSGSTMLNLAVSNRIDCCFAKGKYHFIVGDSKSGKTFLSMTCLAEASKNKRFDKYRFIFDNVEEGADMDIAAFFGQDVAKRLEPPRGTKKDPVHSSKIEEFYYNLDAAFDDGRPFIYILDSMDGLSSKAEEEKHKEQKDAFFKGKDVAGSYGDGKAKVNSQKLRRARAKLKKTGSILIIISQTRDNIGFGAVYNPKTRSGGNVLRFYATTEWWSSCRGEIRKRVKGKDREVGVNIHIDLKKNRITGKEPAIDIPIYHDYGFDDVGSMINYLVEEKHWGTVKKEKVKGEEKKEGKGGAGKTIVCPEWDCTLKYEDLITKIETEELEVELKMIVKKVWEEILQACETGRPRRYS